MFSVILPKQAPRVRKIFSGVRERDLKVVIQFLADDSLTYSPLRKSGHVWMSCCSDSEISKPGLVENET